MIQSLHHLKDDVKLFITMQLIKRNKTKLFSLKEMILAQGFYFKSPSFYSMLRKQGFKLPADSTISRWLPIKNFTAGFKNKEATFTF